MRTWHVFVEDVHGDLDKSWMSNPAGFRRKDDGKLASVVLLCQWKGLTATHVPSCPALTSRSLSALTLAMAFSLAALSFLMGI